MRVPLEIARHIDRGARLGFSCKSDGAVAERLGSAWGSGTYPPPGYLKWNILDVGNGDTYGYYWPIGREEGEPIVCTTMHDCWELLPCASSLAACVRLQLLTRDGDPEELVSVARAFDIRIDDLPISKPDDDEEESGSAIRTPPAHELLRHDPNSPHLRYLAAKDALARRQLDQAEHHLKAAISVLPEYSEALALQAQIARQQQNGHRAAELLMEALTSSRCFGAWDRKKLAGSLQRMDEHTYVGSDPMWKRRHDLAFKEGVKEKSDYQVMEELIEQYHRLGSGVRAVRLRILSGELMSRETVSFRERTGWTAGLHQSLLQSDLERAGLARS